jgi:hypothetical protein
LFYFSRVVEARVGPLIFFMLVRSSGPVELKEHPGVSAVIEPVAMVSLEAKIDEFTLPKRNIGDKLPSGLILSQEERLPPIPSQSHKPALGGLVLKIAIKSPTVFGLL